VEEKGNSQKQFYILCEKGLQLVVRSAIIILVKRRGAQYLVVAAE
jgi:hypothetical protein